MYRAFKLELSTKEQEKICGLDGWYRSGVSQRRLDGQDIGGSVKELVTAQVIDAEKLKDEIFPAFKRDVFISHSHNDERLMYCIAGMLQQEFNLSVFADEFFWGSADSLLKELDDEYCEKLSNHTYSYQDRNLTTSHVHIMLSTAIMKAIDQCEMLLFLNTDNSVPDIAERFRKGKYTMSPWIYQELMFASMVMPKSRSDIEKGEVSLSESVKVAYKLPYDLNMPQISCQDLIRWHEEYELSDKNALDVLYSLKP